MTGSESKKVVRVTANFGFIIQVIDEQQNRYKCLGKKSFSRIVVGDYLESTLIHEHLNLQKILPRKNLISRRVGKKLNTQLMIASNIDQMIVLLTPTPKTGQYLIDALIISAMQQDIKPLLILNKSDLPEFQEFHDRMQNLYAKTNLQLIVVSALKNSNIDRLKTHFQGNDNLIIGASGVGKSTLLNALLGKEYAKTQPLSSYSNQGQHTTSNSISYALNSKTQLIDTPGIREFNLTSYENLDRGYPDLQTYFGKCQFRNCQHDKEQNCALKEAVMSDNVPTERLCSYLFFKAKPNPYIPQRRTQ